MRIIKGILAILPIALASLAQAQMRHDIEKDIPLHEAVRRANDEFDYVPPLTESEVVAAVRAIKIKYPDLKDSIYQVYQRIVKEKVLPRGLFFSRIRQWECDGKVFEVRWKDLSYFDPDSKTGFNYRFRSRFISLRGKNACSPPDRQG